MLTTDAVSGRHDRKTVTMTESKLYVPVNTKRATLEIFRANHVERCGTKPNQT